MVKNYTPTWILLFVLLFTFNFSYSQSNHTVTFNGLPTDFNGVEKIKGSEDIDYYVTFDENYMYFGAFSVANFNSNAQLTIYIDTDPQSIINTGKGTTIGLPSDNKTPTLPFNADHRLSFTRNNQSFHHKYTGSAWEDQAPGIFLSFTQKTTSKSLEIAIDKSKIDNAKGIYFSMFMSRPGPSSNGTLYGISDVNYPIKFNSSNVSTGYFGGIGINAEGVLPTQVTNTPILHTLTNANPVTDGKYAHIEISDGYYTAPGNIELVAGGTTNIAPGSSLTVDGTFSNNGLVTLQSESTSYSSLIATAVDGTGKFNYNRHVNTTGVTGQNDLISPPLSGQSFGDFAANNPNIFENPSNTSQKLFGPYKKVDGTYQIYDTDIAEDAAAILAPANGYRAASKVVAPSTSGGQFTFAGTVNTNAIEKPIFNSGSSGKIWNLVGNPYPSYLKVRGFLENNKTQFASNFIAVYGYDGDATNGWTVLNLANSGTELMAPGQGFFIASKDAESLLTFTPEMRSAGNSDDFILLRGVNGEANEAKIHLKLASASKMAIAEIYFNENGTLGLDPGYDSGFFGNVSPAFSVYSQLVEDNANIDMYIQTLPYSMLSSEVIVPIGIKTTQGQQITVSGIESTLPSYINVYFEDNLAMTSTLLNSSDYIFTPSADLSGMGRFSLRFTNSTMGVSDSNLNNLQIYAPNNAGHLIVKGTVYEGSTLEVYDLNGRLLTTSSIDTNQTVNRYDISNLSSGIYIVKLKNNMGSRIKKIQVN